ncbi:hypothetical protein Fmac_013020 [Flemingia macrophylla]|uniref:Uncharacterized protein n=1 Tax=Flemingia macrophylla TaxID=520843 RepID=A0ABD1MS05_9FABA
MEKVTRMMEESFYGKKRKSPSFAPLCTPSPNILQTKTNLSLPKKKLNKKK